MSSCHSIPDNAVADPDYCDTLTAIPGPRVTLGTFLKVPLGDAGAAFASAFCGSEAIARILTAYNNILFKAGLIGHPFVITRSKVESAIKADGLKRVAKLAHLVLSGSIIHIVKSHYSICNLYYKSSNKYFNITS